jgi:putative membrane protein
MTRHGLWLPPLAILLGVLAVLGYSAIDPVADRLTWLLETFPVMIGAVVLVATRRSFPLTPLSYHLLAFFALILIWGGHYTYADNPLFEWLQQEYDLARNYYDRLGHVFQGFVPAIVAREILLRTSPLRRGGWLFFLTLCVVLSISASYEFFEWWVAIIEGSEATAFLATQGDVWDTQWDMFLAVCGAIAAQLLLARVHDRQLAALAAQPAGQ